MSSSSQEFQTYASDTTGKDWTEITFDERLKLREVFDKKPNGGAGLVEGRN
jgi:hypothetical protein